MDIDDCDVDDCGCESGGSIFCELRLRYSRLGVLLLVDIHEISVGDEEFSFRWLGCLLPALDCLRLHYC